MYWVPVGASLFASYIGPGHFIGLLGFQTFSDIVIAVFEYNAAFTMALLGWLFLPVDIESGVILKK